MSETNNPAPEDTLTIELEDAATRKGWVSTLGLLGGTVQQWHFVGLLGGKPRYESATFAAPYSWGHVPIGRSLLPREEWAPGMNDALQELRGQIRADGWVQVERGENAWQEKYRRVPSSMEASAQ